MTPTDAQPTQSALKHIDIIQSTISRMASNSFALKGWSVAIVSALFALGANDADQRFIGIAFVPAILFWLLDGYFLYQERLFRGLYDKTRLGISKESDLSMNTKEFIGKERTWPASTFSSTITAFHGAIVASVIIAMYLAIKF